MKFLVLLFGLLFSVNSFAASGSGNVSNVVQLGASETTTLGTGQVGLGQQTGTTGVFSVYTATFNPSPTANGVFPFYKNGAVWQVGGSKVAHCFSMSYTGDTANVYWQLMSDTVTFADNATVASLTAPRYQGGRTQAYLHRVYSTLNKYFPAPSLYSFDSANAAFPGIQVGAAGGVMVSMSCYEI